MSRVEEIEAAIESLPPEEFAQLACWIRDRDEDAWDRQMDADAASGKLNFLIEEADREELAVRLLPFPCLTRSSR